MRNADVLHQAHQPSLGRDLCAAHGQLHRHHGRPRAAAPVARSADGAAGAQGAEEEARRGGGQLEQEDPQGPRRRSALSAIANSSGNLLDDDELIEVLSKSKITAVQVNEKLTTAVDTDIRINTAREEYRPAARRGALLYFMVVDMASINNMYMVLLQQFLKLHDLSVNHSEKAPIAAKRIINFMDYMTNYVTRYMHRGLFERPEKIWTLMLAMTIQQIAGTLSATYAGNLLKAGGALDAKSEKPVPAKWMPESVWLNCIALSRTVGMLRDLPDNLERFNDLWKAWYDHDAPETRLFPDYNERLDQFEKMLSCAPSAWTARCWPSTRTLPRRSAVTICSSIRSTLPRCTMRRARTCR